MKEGVDLCELIRNIADYKPKLETSDNVYAKMQEFFSEPTTPTLTEDERVILRNIKWKENMPTTIGRDEKSGLYISFGENLQTGYWSNLFFGHLFQFIKERRRIFYS